VTAGHTIRTAQPGDLEACARLRSDSIDAYRSRLGISYHPPPTSELVAQLAQILHTDPNLFLVVTDSTGLIAMAAAIQRGPTRFLCALYVDEAHQGRGIGEMLLDRVLSPGLDDPLAACTDSLQPVSNAMYARLGMSPREVFYFISGEASPSRPATHSVLLESLPEPSHSDWPRVRSEIDAIDRSILGAQRPGDHSFFTQESHQSWLVKDTNGGTVGYAYLRSEGTLGPVAVTSPELLPITVDAIAQQATSGSISFWLAGSANLAFKHAVSSHLRLTGFPALGCWTRPFADLQRYIPWNLMFP
jgi:GNAT superfamily N-acetyltransferase